MSYFDLACPGHTYDLDFRIAPRRHRADPLLLYLGGMMEGNTLARSVRGIQQMAAHPRDALRWMGGQFTRKSPIELALPWMSWRAIEYLDSYIKPDMSIFEWGGGGSTRFFLRHGCKVATVESSEHWGSSIQRAAVQDQYAAALELRLIPAGAHNPEAVARYIQSVHEGGPWDIIVVDGVQEDYLGRMECLQEASREAKPGGIVVLDDAWRPQYASAPQILSGWERRKFQGLGPSRPGVTRTDIYFAPQRT